MHLFKLLLSHSALSDVAGDFGKTDEVAGIVFDAIDDDRGPEFRSVLTDAPTLGFEPSLFCSFSQRMLGDSQLKVARCVELAEMLSDDFIRRVTLDALSSRIPCRDVSLRSELKDRVIDNRFDQLAVASFASEQIFVCLLSFGDVASDFGKANQLAVFVTDGVEDHKRPKATPVLAHAPPL